MVPQFAGFLNLSVSKLVEPADPLLSNDRALPRRPAWPAKPPSGAWIVPQGEPAVFGRGTLASMGARTNTGLTPAGFRDAIRTPAGRATAAMARLPHWLPLAGIMAVYLGLALAVIERGFLEYNADGYTRIIRGHEWLAAPRWEVGVWLPAQTWLFGLALAVHADLADTPRIVNASLSLATLGALFLIGATFAGPWAGRLAAALGACFPWMVWFGVSGMSEPLFHAALAGGLAGFVRWHAGGSRRWLGLMAGGLALATAVRYEGWFYAAVAAPLLLASARRSGRLDRTVVASAVLPFAFPLVWVQQWWVRFGDPFGFARETSAIKAALDAENATAGLLRKLTAYPEATARLAPWLALLCAAAAGYVLVRRVPWWPYLVLVGGQAALLVGTSAGFSNLGPGAERYLLSNFILLFPVLAAAVVLLPRRLPRVAGALVVVVVSMRLLPTLLDPPTAYPDADTRAAAKLAGAWAAHYKAPLPDPLTPVLLPAAPADGFNASYAFRILSGRPDGWVFTSDPGLFALLATSGRAPFWVLDTSVGAEPPPAGMHERAGRFLLGVPALPESGGASPPPLR